MNDKKLMLSLVALASLCLTALPLMAQPQSQDQPKIRVLFIHGGHEFDTKALYKMLDSFTDITYDKAEMPKALDLYRPGLEKKYDCIVMYDSYKFPYTKEQTDNFKKLLEEGIALVVLHHSVWGFNGWSDFANITGGQCFFKDGYEVNGTTYAASTWDDDQTIHVKIADKNHPITHGINDFTIVDETYAKAYIRPDVHVLWTTDHPKSDKVIAWTWKYAKSPVFTMMQGHDDKAYSNPNFSRTIHQAIRWTVEELRKEKSLTPGS
jgi:type 1 glutamine amidotransferase